MKVRRVATRSPAVIGTGALCAVAKVGVQVVPLTASDAPGIARVRSAYRLRMPDAVALYTALTTGSELATFDEMLTAAAHLAGVTLA